jgi:hypothetical protein
MSNFIPVQITIQKNIHEIDSQMHGSIEAKSIGKDKDKYIIRSLMDEAISSSQLEPLEIN